VVRIETIGKIFNLGHVFSLFPSGHHFTFQGRFFTRFKQLSIVVFIRSFSLVVESEFRPWLLAQLASWKQ
jgi:hypothetical protein